MFFSNSAVLNSATAGSRSNFVDIESDGSKVEDGLLSSECETPMYEKPQFDHYYRQDSVDRHVQFEIGKWNLNGFFVLIYISVDTSIENVFTNIMYKSYHTRGGLKTQCIWLKFYDWFKRTNSYRYSDTKIPNLLRFFETLQ